MRSRRVTGLCGSTESAAGMGLFAFAVRARRLSTRANVGAAPMYRWRYVSPGASGLVAGTATNRHADRFTRPAHDTGAWKWNANAQRAVVLQQSEDSREEPIGSLGAEVS
jgi:hypothetical protein